MTLNNVLDRVKLIALAHKQVRGYTLEGLETDSENEHTRKYPHIVTLVKPGVISISQGMTVFDFTMFISDLVNVSADSKRNEQDVVSDAVEIAQDIFTQLRSPDFEFWRVTSGDAILNFFFERGGDMDAGVAMDFSIGIPYTQNRCEIPSDIIVSVINDDDMGKPVYDVEYIGKGTENLTLDSEAVGSSLNVIKGKKILAVIRESAPLHRVANLPDPAEFTWNDLVIGLGAPVNQPIGGKGERFLVLYRNY